MGTAEGQGREFGMCPLSWALGGAAGWDRWSVLSEFRVFGGSEGSECGCGWMELLSLQQERQREFGV